jgi:hypothetical protein
MKDFSKIYKNFFFFFTLTNPLADYKNLHNKILVSDKNLGVLKYVLLNKLQHNCNGKLKYF